MVVGFFVVVFIYGAIRLGERKTMEYSTGIAFKTEEELRRHLDSLVNETNALWNNYLSSGKIDKEILKKIQKKMGIIRILCDRLNLPIKSIVNWYEEYLKEIEKI